MPLFNAGRDIQDLVVTASGILLIATAEGVMRSLDQGSTWEVVLSEDECFKTLQIGPSEAIVVDASHISMDEGATWQSLSEQVSGHVLSSAFDAEGTLYVGTQGWGVYKTAVPLRANVQNHPLSMSFSAELVPNPVSLETTLRINLKEAGEVVIEMFDVLGRKQIEVNRGVFGPGDHDFTLDTKGFFQGRYFVRLRVGDEGIDIPLAIVR